MDGLDFPVRLHGQFEKVSDTISKCRCSIFYKYLNRNMTYIDDDFAELLISSLPYTPVKGIYDSTVEDYEDHGKKNSEGRIYGLVPENPNQAWVEHEDEDGVTRVYCDCDVYIYTALYGEAEEILGKGESMELYPPSVKGQWTLINGIKCFKFTSGSFFGLQVLGDEVEPCFEGAKFFSLYEYVEKAFKKLDELSATFNKKILEEKKMDRINFKLSDSTKYDLLFMALNPDFNEEGKWSVDESICEVYDGYAVCRKHSTGTFERVYYTKKEDDTISIDKIETCYITDVNEVEKAVLDSIYAMNNNSFEKLDETFSKIPALEEKVTEIEQQNSEFSLKIEESQNENNTLKLENENLTTNYAAAKEELDKANAAVAEFTITVEGLNSNIASLNSELEGLRSYKLAIEKANKQKIIDKYAGKLDAEIMSKYTADTELSIEDLKKELAFELVEHDQSLFSKKDEEDDGIVPVEVPLSGLEAILSKYENKNN